MDTETVTDLVTQDDLMQASRAIRDGVKSLLAESSRDTSALVAKALGRENSAVDRHVKQLEEVHTRQLASTVKSYKDALGEQQQEFTKELERVQQALKALPFSVDGQGIDWVVRMSKSLEDRFSKMLEDSLGALSHRVASLEVTYAQRTASLEKAYGEKTEMLTKAYTAGVEQLANSFKALPAPQVYFPEKAITVQMEKSIVHVQMPEGLPPVVNVSVPEQAAPRIEVKVPPARLVKKKMTYNQYGQVEEIDEQEKE